MPCSRVGQPGAADGLGHSCDLGACYLDIWIVLCRYHLLQSKGSSIQLVCSSRRVGTRYLQDMLLWRYLELKLYQFSPRVSSGSDFLGNTPRPEHFGIPQRIATRHPKNIYHYTLHFPPLPVPSAIMSAPQSVQCFGKKKTGTAESPSHDQESVAK